MCVQFVLQRARYIGSFHTFTFLTLRSGNSTPGRHKTPAGITGVSKGSLANASLPSDSVATGKPKAQGNNGLDVLV